jgi:hypothetical protein
VSVLLRVLVKNLGDDEIKQKISNIGEAQKNTQIIIPNSFKVVISTLIPEIKFVSSETETTSTTRSTLASTLFTYKTIAPTKTLQIKLINLLMMKVNSTELMDALITQPLNRTQIQNNSVNSLQNALLDEVCYTLIIL